MIQLDIIVTSYLTSNSISSSNVALPLKEINMQQKIEQESGLINLKTKAISKQHSLSNHAKIPSFMPLLRQAVDYDINKTNSFSYIEYIAHFIRSGHLNTVPILEVNYLCAAVKFLIQENAQPDSYKEYINYIAQLLLAVDVNGADEVHFYTQVEEFFNGNSNYTYNFVLTQIKNDFFLNLLEGLDYANNPSIKRREYIVNLLILSIKSCLKDDKVFFHLNSKDDGKNLIKLIDYCLNLGVYDKYKEDILFIIKGYTDLNYYLKSGGYGMREDSLGFFKIGQFLIEKKEYQTFQNLIENYFALSTKHQCLYRGCECPEERKLTALIYALKLQSPIPQELKEICDQLVYQQATEIMAPNIALEKWEDYVTTNTTHRGLLKYQSNRDTTKSQIIAELFSSSVIKNYSAKDIIEYYSKIYSVQMSIISKEPRRASVLEQSRRDAARSKINFIKNIITRLHKTDLKNLDLQTKLDLMHIYKCAHLPFDFFNLLHNLTKEEQKELIHYYKTNFNITQQLKKSEFILNAYPLDEHANALPESEKKIAMPLGLYMDSLAHEKVLSISFGCGLFQMENDAETISFNEIEPLLKDRNAIISFKFDGLYYADLNLKKIRKLKITEDNQNEILQLSSKCTSDYQLADETTCKLIMSLTGIIPPFQMFYRLFDKKNQYLREHAGEHNTVDYTNFMITYAIKMSNLYEFMGEDVFLFMKKILNTSLQNLERYFENLILIPVEYIPLLQEVNKKFKSDIIKGESRSFEVLLTLIGQLELFLLELAKSNKKSCFSKEIFLKKFASVAEETKSILDLTDFIVKEISDIYKILLDIPEHCKIDTFKFTQDPLLLSRLLIARNAMKEEKLDFVFDTLIEYDLRTDVNFTDFAYTPNQQHALGQELSLHNQKIEQTLSKAGINTEQAFNYRVAKKFSAGDNNFVDLPTMANTLYADIKSLGQILSLKTPLKFFEDDESKERKGIRKCIDQIKKQVEKKLNTVQVNAILNGEVDKQLKIIEPILEKLFKLEPLNMPLKEHGQHFVKHRDQLFIEIAKSKTRTKQKKEKKRNFEITQWDKNELHTFLLGDYLSCCLAPDGSRFPAMVERRMDAAMMMHVILDEEINQPVCGNWLFFAYDQQNPNDIYVVANFFEIRASYGLKKELSKKLVTELLDFTGQYAKSIGAKGFIMRPLRAGSKMPPTFLMFIFMV